MVPSFLKAAAEHGWTIDTIGGLLEKKALIGLMDGNHGNLYPRSEEFANEGVPYVSATNFLNNRVDYSKVKHLPEPRAAKLKKGIALDGDVLFAHNATVGPVALLETELTRVILSTSVTYHRCDPDKLHNKFWLAYLESPFFQRQVERIMRQTTRSQVPITAQKELWATLPPLQEQRKIADILSTWDAAIEKTEALLATAKSQKRSLMQSLLTGKRRFPEFEGQPWQEVRLGDLSEISSGPAFKSDAFSNDGFRLVRGSNVKRGHLDWSRSITVHWPNDDGLSDFKVGAGDIVIAMDGYVGRSHAYIRTEPELPMLLVQRVARVRARKANSSFLYACICTHGFFAHCERMKTATGIAHITMKDIRNFIVPGISRAEQDAIGHVFDASDLEIIDLVEQLGKLRIEKKALMQQLLTGKRRVVV